MISFNLFWNETLLALRFDVSTSGPHPRFGCVEAIGDCLQRFPFAPRMRTGAWMLDTFMRIAPMKSLLDRGLSQAGVLDRRLSPDTWATCWSDGTFGTCRHPTRDSASLHPCRQAAYFLPCTRPTDACGSCLDRPRHRRPQVSLDRTQVRAFVITRAGTATGGSHHLCSGLLATFFEDLTIRRHFLLLLLSATSGAFSFILSILC